MPLGETTNIGQIAALWIAATAPTNTKLIWYDTAQNIHRIYETTTGNWIALNPQAVTNSTISALTVIAQGTGIAIGKFFYLTDVGTLAIALTSTKIWYVDTHSNYIVNDLAAAIQYYINSTNLYIDGNAGVWNTSTGRLEFTFTEENSLNQTNDYVVIRRKNGSVWSWVKSKISNFISTVANNSIIWNNGIYFSFSANINSILNQSGGIVGYDQYLTDIQLLVQDINNVALDNQNYLQQAKTYTDSKTTAAEIYGKGLPAAITPSAVTQTAPVVGWSINRILQDIYGWFGNLKYANNINVGINFNPAGSDGNVDATDSVMLAIQKLVKKVANLYVACSTAALRLSAGWAPYSYWGTVPDVAANDTVDTAFSKLVGRMNQLGIITNGVLKSREIQQSQYNTLFEIEAGRLEIGEVDDQETVRVSLSNDGIQMEDHFLEQDDLIIKPRKISQYNHQIDNYSQYYDADYFFGAEFLVNGVDTSHWSQSSFGAALVGMITIGGYRKLYGLYSNKALLRSLHFKQATFTFSDTSRYLYMSESQSFVRVVSSYGYSGVAYLYLPPVSDSDFEMVFFVSVEANGLGLYIQASSGAEIEIGNGSTAASIQGTEGDLFMFIFRPGFFFRGLQYNEGTWSCKLINH